MTRIVCVEPDGRRVSLDATDGDSLMRAAVDAGVQGIEAQCGGSCSCATCHCYVDAEWIARLPPPGADELIMLENVAAERRAGSRLSCQIGINPDLAGLTVCYPDRQL